MMTKLGDVIRGFFSCSNLIKHCILPKDVKKKLKETEEKYETTMTELNEIRRARIEYERKYKAIEAKLTLDGDPEWYRVVRGEKHV